MSQAAGLTEVCGAEGEGLRPSTAPYGQVWARGGPRGEDFQLVWATAQGPGQHFPGLVASWGLAWLWNPGVLTSSL